MNCREVIAFVTRYVEDELSAGERRVFEAHVDVCPDCREFIASYRTTMRLPELALIAPEAPIPEAVPEELIAAVLAATETED